MENVSPQRGLASPGSVSRGRRRRRGARAGVLWLAAAASVLAGGALGSCYTAAPIDAAPLDVEASLLPTPYFLGPGDLLSLRFLDLPQYSSDVTGVLVDRDGYVSVPGLDPVLVDGLRLMEAREAILEEARRHIRNPRLALSVIEYGARQYYVYGEVQLSQPFPLDQPTTALQALSRAGGFKSGALRDRVAILRPEGPEGPSVHYFDAETPGADGMIYLRPNDLVFVAQSSGGRLRDQVLPVIQAVSSSAGLVTSFAIVQDTLED